MTPSLCSHLRDWDGVFYFAPGLIFGLNKWWASGLYDIPRSKLYALRQIQTRNSQETDVMDLIRDDCAGGLVFCKSKLVVLERFNKVWLFPKGHIDPGETAREAAVREVREECGLTARILVELGETSYFFMEKEKEHFKTVRWFLMESISGELTFEKDFFTAVDLIPEPDIGRLTFEVDRELARKAFQIYRKMKS